MQKDLKLIINLHRSPLLADAVAALFTDPTDQMACARSAQRSKDACVHITDRGITGWDRHESALEYKSAYYSDYTFIDAATEFGKLVALLEKPEPKVIKDLATTASGRGTAYDGFVKEDRSGISAGCSFVPSAKVKEAYEALFGEGK